MAKEHILFHFLKFLLSEFQDIDNLDLECKLDQQKQALGTSCYWTFEKRGMLCGTLDRICVFSDWLLGLLSF